MNPRLSTRLRRIASRGVVAGALVLASLSAVAQTSGTTAPPPPPPHRGPPVEALAACQSLIAGDTCVFTLGSARIDGTCEAPPGRQLACRPNNMPPPPPLPQGGEPPPS